MILNLKKANNLIIRENILQVTNEIIFNYLMFI